MKKVTKKDLNERLLMVETLLGLHRVLPEQISNEQATNAIFRMQCALSSGKELAEREQPKPKQLDQSVFDGLDAKWRFAAIDFDSEVRAFEQRPVLATNGMMWDSVAGEEISLGKGVRVIKWYNSLIERDKVELTGSDLARAMLARGDKYVLCHLSQTSEKSAKDVLGIAIGYDHSGFRVQRHNSWQYAVPINNQGEPLTQSEAGL